MSRWCSTRRKPMSGFRRNSRLTVMSHGRSSLDHDVIDRRLVTINSKVWRLYYVKRVDFHSPPSVGLNEPVHSFGGSLLKHSHSELATRPAARTLKLPAHRRRILEVPELIFIPAHDYIRYALSPTIRDVLHLGQHAGSRPFAVDFARHRSGDHDIRRGPLHRIWSLTLPRQHREALTEVSQKVNRGSDGHGQFAFDAPRNVDIWCGLVALEFSHNRSLP
jgi:hypothetical protein